MEYLTKLEEITGKKFGDPKNPCWSPSAPAPGTSMPGMMDTILNLGLNDTVVEGLCGDHQQSPLCLRLLPPLYPDVLRRGHGALQEAL